MQYLRYGNAGIEVSRICLGAMTFYQRLPEPEATALVRQCLDLGLNFIDTADSYGEGESEAFLGRALAGVRHEVIIATKAYASNYLGRRRAANGSRHHLVQAVEASLKRLQTDYLDLFMCHHPDPLTPFEETYSTLDSLVKQGKIRYVAMCNAYAWQVAHCLGVCAANGWEPPVSVQVSYSLVDRAAEIETWHMARRFNLVLQSYSPQAGGLLTGKYRRGETPPTGSRAAKFEKFAQRLTDSAFDVVDAMEEIAARNHVTLGQLAVCWILSRPAPFVPIVGGSQPEHILPLLECPDLALPAEDLDRLTELTDGFRFGPWYNQPQAAAPGAALNRW